MEDSMTGPGEITAAITGATSGIGAAFARRLAAQGHHLLVTGRRRGQIEALADTLVAQYGVGVHVIIAELADDEDLSQLTARVAGLSHVQVLVNNAGFGLGGQEFYAQDFSGHVAMLKVHALATLQLTYAALPAMLAHRRGSIINIASVAAFVPLPRHAMYSATKDFILTFSEALAIELRGKGVRVQALCPGFTRTDFHARQGIDTNRYYRSRGPLRAMMPDEVVSASLGCLERGHVVCVPGLSNRLLTHLARLLPRRLLYRLLASLREP
jgi:short-subunit dehydrogenase